MMKYILGLDLGTNSVGWALIQRNIEEKYGKIIGMGSRIIPMSQDILGKFDAGQSISQTAERTGFRGVRRLYQRDNLRRERLHRVLNVLGFLPTHYADAIDFEKRLGQFKENQEPKLPYAKKDEKFDFIFKSSFEEMVADFRKHQPQLFYIKPNGKESQIPYDWTIYYLRKKALSEKISKEELAWILLNFNQKRGYYQLRGEEEQTDENKSVKFYALKVVKVEEGDKNKKGDTWYNVHLENGWIYRRTSKNFLDWEGKIKEFIVTEKLNEDGTIKVDKEGKEDRSLKAVNSEEDWIVIKKSTEDKIHHSEKTVGTYIYDTLLQEPNQKIRGKLIRTIERKFYKEELIKILKKQIELQPEIFTKALYKACIEELYTHNEAHRKSISDRGFVYLFVDDIIFYQRPLKSKKSLIAKCSLEERSFVVEENGKREEKIEGIKCIAKTNPIYQEFRVLQWMYNLKIYEKFDNKDVTSLFISSIEDKENLFEFLMSQKEVNHKHILDYFVTQKVKNEFPNAKPKAFKEEVKRQMALYRWNYVYDEVKDESKTYPMNETGYEIRKRFEKVTNLPVDFYTKEKEYYLWHLIYSVTDKLDFEKALKKYAIKYGLDIESFVESFKNIKPYPSEYGGFSEKAIKKLLPLMRFGKFWDFNQISKAIQSRIQFIINGEFSEDIPLNVREQVFKFQLNKEADFQGLPLWLAQYVVYNRHSESSDLQKWTSVEELQKFLKEFRQHSLRNPIVEQIVTETLRVVRDVWQLYGNGEKDFFSEIHVEMGRELKKTAEERNDETKKNNKNEATNLRLKALLMEMANDPKVENVRPHSPSQLEILKIYEEGVLGLFSEDELKKEGGKKDEIYIISKKSELTKSELQRYKLWLEQKYQSPYTGEIIPLNKLFTDNYQIEHIIPQSKFFDDSFSNKVICESVVNGLKDNQLGFEFIKNHHGEKIQIGDKIVTIFSEEQYKDFVSKTYANNRVKREKLLMEEIPEKMVARQINDTRYISKYVSQILSKIVRVESDDDGVNSKNLIFCTGKITTRLKQDWGLNDVWNESILPRFERLNILLNTDTFTAYSEKHQKMLPIVPIEHSKGFQKKRIDHRHHALDALVIACATRDHINLINNESAKSNMKRYDLKTKLQRKEKYTKEGVERDTFKEFYKPWETFTQDAKEALEQIIVSFKQNNRVINKSVNYYQKWEKQADGLMKKVFVKQTKGDNWAIRKPLHKDTVSGQVHLDRIKVSKGKILTATRKSLDTTFDEKKIASITDTGIQKILLNYLKYKGSSELAFSPEGIDEMNENITQFNDGIQHKPIYKVRVFEMGSKFNLGNLGNKNTKFVEAAKGTNLFFAIYSDKEGNRSYETIPLNIVIERQKQGMPSCPDMNEKGNRLLFSLSPNDLVYVPTEEEQEHPHLVDFNNLNKEQIKRVYKIVSFTGNRLYAIPNTVAKSIVDKVEFTQLNKVEFIKEKQICIKINVDRLGNIITLTSKRISEKLDKYK